MDRYFFLFYFLLLCGCESVGPLYKVNNGNEKITLKIDSNGRIGQFLENRLYMLLNNTKTSEQIMLKVGIQNKKYSEVKFLDGTVGRIIDEYCAHFKIITVDDYNVLAEDVVSVSASKNYSSSKVQIMESTISAIDYSLVEELAHKIFNYVKVKVDNKNFIHQDSK